MKFMIFCIEFCAFWGRFWDRKILYVVRIINILFYRANMFHISIILIYFTFLKETRRIHA